MKFTKGWVITKLADIGRGLAALHINFNKEQGTVYQLYMAVV